MPDLNVSSASAVGSSNLLTIDANMTSISMGGFNTAPSSYNYGAPMAASTPNYNDQVFPSAFQTGNRLMVNMVPPQTAYCSPHYDNTMSLANRTAYCRSEDFNRQYNNAYSHSATRNMETVVMAANFVQESGYATDLNTTMWNINCLDHFWLQTKCAFLEVVIIEITQCIV